MVRITPCRNLISDRFSVASFVVHVPPECVFEIACTTDPELFRPDQRHRRTARNFVSSRLGGLLRAPAGHATYIVPPEHLLRFAGNQRIYYAIGSYRGASGEDARFSISLDAPRQAPYIQLAPDFTGRQLDRGRLRNAPQEARYGAVAPEALIWGADLVAAARPSPPPAAPRVGTAQSGDYDDGFDAALWSEPRAAHGSPAADLAGYEDAPDLRRAGGASQPVAPAVDEELDEDVPDRDGRYGRALAEPDGFEDAVALARHQRTHGAAYGGGEPDGYEDGRALRARAPARYGQADAADEPAPRAVGRAAARHEEYGADDERAPRAGGRAAARRDDELAPGPAAGFRADFTEYDDEPAEAVRPLGPADRVRIGDGVFAALYGSNLYDHAAASREAGLVWGGAGFSQATGSLGEALAIARRRDPDGFLAHFGDDADELLRVTRARTPAERLAPVGGRPLTDPEWVDRFRVAGRHPAFAAAQREAADVLFFQPALPFARCLGLQREPELALLFDRCVHMGVGEGCRYFLEHAYPRTRRRDLEPALQRLGAGSLGELRARAGLSSEERFDAMTAAAIVGELRRRGDVAGDPVDALVRGEEQAQADASPQRREVARRILRVHRGGSFNQAARFSV